MLRTTLKRNVRYRFVSRRNRIQSRRLLSSFQDDLPESVLVANRGEIACRVFKTAKRLGVRTVAIYTDKDLSSRHIVEADEAHKVSEYLAQDEILEICRTRGVESVHPGYGFLSENPDFASKIEDRNVRFLGPRASTIVSFGLKDEARRVASDAGVEVVPGSDTLQSLQHASKEAERLGYPVLLKAVAGGGGIGMSRVNSANELGRMYESVVRQSEAAFGNSSMYLEKYVQSPRHIEVQIFGDGKGNVVSLGERECSIQRRYQKIIEESPSPFVNQDLRERLCGAAVKLGENVSYRSAGTVEFLVDGVTGEFYFLEMNTRLQVEHPISELTNDVDLVEWMLGRSPKDLMSFESKFPIGHAIEARLYCEDPPNNFLPSPGRLDLVKWPSEKDARVDTWIETGTVVTPNFDPMVAKLIVHSDTNREDALTKFQDALSSCELRGTTTNLEFCEGISKLDGFVEGKYDTGFLESSPSVFENLKQGVFVEDGGINTTVQDLGRTPQRMGKTTAWSIGIPPSGAMDDVSARVSNRLVGNDENAAVLECTSRGPTLRFNQDTTIAIAGKFENATLNGKVFDSFFEPVSISAGDVLKMGTVTGSTMRGYLAVQGGGIDVPEYLNSKSTLALGNLGGFQGRPLVPGDNLRFTDDVSSTIESNVSAAKNLQEKMYEQENLKTIGVLVGPQDDYFTDKDMETFFNTSYEVDYNSNRMGIRLKGPAPSWARESGGEGGSHPSNVVDNTYALGTINWTGDLPVAITCDGPSLGGFSCNVTSPSAERWKFAQLCPGDKIRFEKIDMSEALRRRVSLDQSIAKISSNNVENVVKPKPLLNTTTSTCSILHHQSQDETKPELRIRLQGDEYVLVEYGNQTIDLNNRFRLFNLEQNLIQNEGIVEISPGISSMQIHYDNTQISVDELVDTITKGHNTQGDVSNMTVPSRIVNLPIVLNDRWNLEALKDYAQSIRSEAPYLPSNFDFVARNNGIDVERLREIVLSAEYMVLGLGDVYLGCPAALPVDPRHRLVCPKFNPARTYTPKGAVGIGGAFMCAYPLRSPGGYQLIGRSLPIWNMFEKGANFTEPWLLRHFDRIRFHEVTHEELESQFDAFENGITSIDIEDDATFDVKEYNDKYINDPTVADETRLFRENQQKAAAVELRAEREYWNNIALTETDDQTIVFPENDMDALAADPSISMIHAEFTANVWKLEVEAGTNVKKGDPVVIFEAMKMEYSVEAPCDGVVKCINVRNNDMVQPGDAIIAIETSADDDKTLTRTMSYRDIVRSHSNKDGRRIPRPDDTSKELRKTFSYA